MFRVLLITLFVAVCGWLVLTFEPNSREPVQPSVYDTPLTSASVIYEDDVKPILDTRCVVCHACYDAPCQLKLGSFEGIARGASKDPVYKGDRILAANLSRLFIDAHSATEWRKKSFFAVLNEQAINPQNNLDNSLLVKMLEQKQAHPLGPDKKLGEGFDLDLNREWQCPTVEDHAAYLKDYPKWGMPYGLPALNEKEHATLVDWIELGAATRGHTDIAPATLQEVQKWERFLNQASFKHQLTARYLYEHFFIAHLYFGDENADIRPTFFRLFRSSTPPGEPVDMIARRRPFADPGVDRVYYRFVPVRETIVDKTHMPFRLNDARLAEYQAWFIDADYSVTQLPGYQPEKASNPFVTFQDIPINARYRFMLSEAQYTIMQFIKGPVCRGQIALNVINDHFWVFFAEPSLAILEHEAAFLSQARHKITLPAEADSNASPTNWITYAEQEKDYREARADYINKTLHHSLPLDLTLIWDGEQSNDNLALTVFRHSDAASVVKGLVGDTPQTAWIITYPLFERIHYLLVAGYDVYGNLGHQLNSRMYMDFLRMEGEFNFLALLPKQTREEVWNHWYRGIVSPVEKYVASADVLHLESRINYQTDAPLSELYQLMRNHVSAAESGTHNLSNGFDSDAFISALHSLNQMRGHHVSLLPEASFVRVINERGDQHFYTLLRNSAHSNISHIIAEQARRMPEEDTLSVGYGFISSHPNALFQVKESDMPVFAEQIARLKNAEDVERLFDRFGVRRTSENFWPYSDALHQFYRQHSPVKFGYFDFNRLEDL